MIHVHKIISSGFGIGYLGKGSGTVAAAVCCILWYLFRLDLYFTLSIVATLAIIIIGIWSSNEVELLWGHDSARVVIDEIAGMAIAMIALPLNWKYFVTAFVLFRFFDIVKPLYIRKMELFPGGWGVMMDDVLAGIYALLLVQLMVRLNIF